MNATQTATKEKKMKLNRIAPGYYKGTAETTWNGQTVSVDVEVIRAGDQGERCGWYFGVYCEALEMDLTRGEDRPDTYREAKESLVDSLEEGFKSENY